jgi:hypothetical protein
MTLAEDWRFILLRKIPETRKKTLQRKSIIGILRELRGDIAAIKQEEEILRTIEKIKELLGIESMTRGIKTSIKGLGDRADKMS